MNVDLVLLISKLDVHEFLKLSDMYHSDLLQVITMPLHKGMVCVLGSSSVFLTSHFFLLLPACFGIFCFVLTRRHPCE